jgi:hypothetical protein
LQHQRRLTAEKEAVKEVGFNGGRVGVYRVRVLSLGTLAIFAVVFGGGIKPVQAGPQAATVRHISVTGDDHDPGIEINATRPIVPRTQTVTGPDRLIALHC